ncbi:hypothetical protein BCR36DRAFT_400545 [Piromyces finnis]|uniref:Uncharacterized protein n=1 Tax=Piromyces finnis TaxID=1754191 RepID=A0A1Y1UVB8_9FUNG|nr:hypothetical protein BCR36DRAFT_400545 [Piromyces finnis]|eukprot:ORX41901.1 hypothetical protein BCR36DRAFT_400545 [Piromyces finnis]
MKSVNFNENIEVLYTHPNDYYDRKCVPIVKVNFKIATEIMQYRLDMKREYTKLYAAAANATKATSASTTNDTNRLHNYPILA